MDAEHGWISVRNSLEQHIWVKAPESITQYELERVPTMWLVELFDEVVNWVWSWLRRVWHCNKASVGFLGLSENWICVVARRGAWIIIVGSLLLSCFISRGISMYFVTLINSVSWNVTMSTNRSVFVLSIRRSASRIICRSSRATTGELTTLGEREAIALCCSWKRREKARDMEGVGSMRSSCVRVWA